MKYILWIIGAILLSALIVWTWVEDGHQYHAIKARQLTSCLDGGGKAVLRPDPDTDGWVIDRCIK